MSRGRARPAAAPVRVVMTTRYPLSHPGGVESVARALMHRIAGEDGWTASHVAAYSGRAGTARVPLLGDLIAAGRLAVRVIGKGDVLLVHGAEYAWGPLAVGRLTGRPVVAVWHGVRAAEAIPPARRRTGRAARRIFAWAESALQRAALRADATVAVSPSVAMEVRSRYGFRGGLRVIPNGVSTRTPRPAAPRRDDRRDPARPALRAIWVGTTAYKKGLDIAVAACALARARGLEASLTVAGLPAGSAGRGVPAGGPWLTWLGAVPPGEIEGLYRRHDALLFPTRREPFGLVVLEAMAAGLPVIGSDAVRWLIAGGGAAVAGEDPGRYADALFALADPERRRALGGAALKRAREFSWEAAAAGYLEVLDDVGRPGRDGSRHP